SRGFGRTEAEAFPMKSLRQWKGGIVAAASIVLAAGSVYAAPGENLIRNGGFEDADEMPQVWDLFVAPHEGAWGGVESEGAAEGERCVFLETTTPYAQEPYNNWSQNILDDVAGKELVARATVKTEGAGEAVVWVQCWRREPWSMIKVFASST